MFSTNNLSIKPVYVLGTGLSHDGSSCLLKDGRIVCAIEKERLSRRKHDGGNDMLTVQYCLNQAGITVNDLSLVVQAANFEKESIEKHSYQGKRFFGADCNVPFVSISHHLAHAYSAIGTAPFDECNVLVIDGCGSPQGQCDDLDGAYVPQDTANGVYAEKDSFYHFSTTGLKPLYKDLSLLDLSHSITGNRMPSTKHSIGGLYSIVSQYVFGNMDDAGKLMGLAPFGNRDKFHDEIFSLTGGRVFVNDSVFHLLDKPAADYLDFTQRFAYFADIAAWVQKQVEEAILYVTKHRLQYHYHPNLCYAGGVALNAVANARILREAGIQNIYITPAAADNGLSIGCAYYGWLNVLGQPKVPHNGSTYFGRIYTDEEISADIDRFRADNPGITVTYNKVDDACGNAAQLLAQGKVIGWFQGSSEFGPRALGNRSILADGRLKGVQALINRDIKFREDFRPFAPSVMAEDAAEYFEYAFESPYMILVDRVKDKYRDLYREVTHVDGSARVQTLTEQLNPAFYSLLQRFKQASGSGILLNTSFNKKGMPIVETPYQALALFFETRMDVLVIAGFVFEKD
jgi:carbamoyltransferase